MTILVTGGAGFIGSNFMFYMHRHYPEDRLVCLDKLTYAGNIQNLDSLISEPNVRFVKGDICDKDTVDSLFSEERPHIVVNFAAESHVDRSIEAPEVFLQTNIIGTQVLMDASLKYGVKRFHQVSTDEVYGELPLERKDLLFRENTPLCPSSPYSVSKASADMLANAYCRTYQLPVTISRCSNNYGPYQFPEKLLPVLILKAMKGESLPIYGEGRNVRDWIYVEDHCVAIDAIIRHGEVGQVYNVGGGNERENIEMARAVCAMLGASEELITYVQDRKGHDLRYAIDSAKIEAQLGWTPKMDFEQGLAKTIDWYRTHQAWWESIISGEYQELNAEVV